jgi:hypothetical protein
MSQALFRRECFARKTYGGGANQIGAIMALGRESMRAMSAIVKEDQGSKRISEHERRKPLLVRKGEPEMKEPRLTNAFCLVSFPMESLLPHFASVPLLQWINGYKTLLVNSSSQF